MKHILSHLKVLTAALLLCGASLPAAEVTVAAPDSPLLRFAQGKLEAALQQRGDTLKRVSNPAPGQTAALSVTIDPAAADGVGPEGFRLALQRNGRMIAGGDERGAMYGVLDVAEQIRLGTPWNKIECELTDIEAWCAYGAYFAEKLRGGVALAEARATKDVRKQQQAVTALEKALGHWQRLAELGARFNRLPVPSNSIDPFSWASLTPAVERDIATARAGL